MDSSSSDLEFFDFRSISDEEVKEIQAILKGPGSNGCVELPWEIPVKENCIEEPLENEGLPEETDSVSSTKSSKDLGAVVGQALQFTAPQTPVTQLPPPAVETFVTLPTSVGPYPNAPYFVSRTIPYLRAYPHMGVPFFACPIPGTGEAGPYGQFVPVVPATVGQEKFAGQIENDSNQKDRGPSVDRQFNRLNKKKLSSTEYADSFESETVDPYRESSDGLTPTAPVSSAVSSDRPTSVPLPVPPSTFAVAGATLPLHGYPPGLHTLPYTQMSGPQAPSTAMYYVPVFNHPYGSYIPSPPTAPMVLPVNLRPEAEVSELAMNKCSKISDDSTEEAPQIVNSLVTPTSLVNSCEETPNVQSDSEAPEQYSDNVDAQQASVDPTAKNVTSDIEEVTDCNSSSDPLSKSVSSSPDCLPEAVSTDECQPTRAEAKEVVCEPKGCWADLFKKPSSEVNGIDRQIPPPQHRHKNKSTFKKDITNGKVYSVPARDSIH